MAIIYMPLLDEGTDVWQPVDATYLSDDIYRVDETMPDGEKWAFPQGSLVRCERTSVMEDQSDLTAVSLVQ